MWEEGHEFGFGHEFEVLLRHAKGHVEQAAGPMSVGCRREHWW